MTNTQLEQLKMNPAYAEYWNGAPESVALPSTHTAEELTNSSIDMFWGTPGQKTIGLSVTYDGKTMTASRTISVNGLPDVDVATESSIVMLHQSFVSPAEPTYAFETGFNGRTVFQFGEHGLGQTGETGITATYTVEEPQGEFLWVPLIDTITVIYSDDPTRQMVVSTGEGLDREITTGAEFHDSPGFSVIDPLAYRYEITYNFKLVLMWRPNSDSYFVPVKYLDWGWSGEAEKAANGMWEWVGQGAPISYISAVFPTSEFPTWERTYRTGPHNQQFILGDDT